MSASMDQQFIEFVVKSLVSRPDAVRVTRRIDNIAFKNHLGERMDLCVNMRRREAEQQHRPPSPKAHDWLLKL